MSSRKSFRKPLTARHQKIVQRNYLEGRCGSTSDLNQHKDYSVNSSDEAGLDCFSLTDFDEWSLEPTTKILRPTNDSAQTNENDSLKQKIANYTRDLQACMNQLQDITMEMSQLIDDKSQLEVEAEAIRKENQELMIELTTWKSSFKSIRQGILKKLSPDNLSVSLRITKE